VIQSSSKTVHSARLERNVEIHMEKVNTPHIASVSPTPAADGALSQPAPTDHCRNAHHHQNSPYDVNASVPKVFAFLTS